MKPSSSPLKPPALAPGDLCVVVSPSWGGAAEFPHVQEAGLSFLRQELGLSVRESRHARQRAASVAERLADLHEAFADPEVRMVVASIGGDDSVRLLPGLDLSALHANPKVVLGYSDTSTLLTHMAQAGLVSFHGPSVMAGFAQAPSLGAAFTGHVRRMLFDPAQPPAYEPYGFFCEGYDWSDPARVCNVLTRVADTGPRVLQGSGVVTGSLFGGCLEVLEFLEGTPYWPMGDAWCGRVLFFETSEEAPPISMVRRALRSFGVAGMFERLHALLVGRPRDYTLEQKRELDQTLLEVVRDEFGSALPIVTNLDFGHTDPQWILPLGVPIELDFERGQLRLLESPVAPRGAQT